MPESSSPLSRTVPSPLTASTTLGLSSLTSVLFSSTSSVNISFCSGSTLGGLLPKVENVGSGTGKSSQSFCSGSVVVTIGVSSVITRGVDPISAGRSSRRFGLSRTKLKTLLCRGEGMWGLGGRSSFSLSLVCRRPPSASPPGELGLTDSLELALSTGLQVSSVSGSFFLKSSSVVDPGVISSTPESGVVKSNEGVRVGIMVVVGNGEGGGGKSSVMSSERSRSKRDGFTCLPGKNWLVVDMIPKLSKGRADDEIKKSSS